MNIVFVYDEESLVTEIFLENDEIPKQEYIEKIKRLVSSKSDHLKYKFENWTEEDQREIKEIYDLR